MKRHLLTAFAIVSGTALLGACASTGAARSKTDKLTMMSSVKIEVGDAIKAALAKTPGRVVDTELQSKKGKTVWEIDIATADGKVSEVDVDATSGEVTDAE